MLSSRTLRRSALLLAGAVFVCFASLVLGGGRARAAVSCEVNWVGSAGGGNDVDWNDPLNWDSAAVPTATDNVCAPSTANIDLNGSPGAANQVDLQGSLTIAGVALDVYDTDGPSSTSTIHDLTLAGSSGIGSGGAVDLTGTATLGNGTGSTGFSGGPKTLISGATATIGDTLYIGDYSAPDVVFTNDGTISYDAGTIWLGDNAEFHNAGSFTATFDGYYIDDTFSTIPPRWFNTTTGTFTATDNGYFGLLSDNDGSFQVQGGTTTLAVGNPTGGADAGDYDISGGARLVMQDVTATYPRTLDTGSSVSGSGVLRLESNNAVNWNITDSVANLELNSVDVGGTGALTVDSSLLFDGGTTYLSDSLTLTAGASTVTSKLSWTGLSDSASFVNAGTLTTAADGFALDGTASVVNSASGTMTFSNPFGGTILSCIYTCTPSVGYANNGTLHTDAFPGNSWILINAPFDNDGTVVVDSGNVSVGTGNSAGGDDDGAYQTVSAGDSVAFTAGSRQLDTGASVTGPGPLVVGGATTTWGSATPIGNLQFTAGSITGSPTITSSAVLNGGSFVGSGTATIGSSANLVIGPGSVSVANAYQLLNKGTGSLGASSPYVCDTAVFRNEGTLNITAAGQSIYDCGAGTGRFQNASGAVVNVSVPASSFAFNIDTVNDGTINDAAGTLYVYRNNSAGDQGSWNAAAGANIIFSDTHDFTGGTLGGAGLKTLSGTFTGTPTVSAGTLVVNGSTIGTGTTTVGVGAKLTQLGQVDLDGGTLDNKGTYDWLLGDVCSVNSGDLVNDGTWNIKTPGYSFYDCYSSTGGTVTNAAGGTINKSTAWVVHFFNLTTHNDGLMSVTGGGLEMADLDNFSAGTLTGGTYRMTNGRITAGGQITRLDARVEFLPGGVWRDITDTWNAIDTLAVITANGALVADTGGLVFGPVDSSGLVEVRNTNTVTFASLLTHATTKTKVRDVGSVVTIASPLVNDGELSGNGIVTAAGAVLNNGQLSPGNSSGILTVSGGLVMSPLSTTAIEVAGATVGTGYDRVAVNGATALNGTLAISTPGPFYPTSGTFTIVTSTGPLTGTFSSVTGYNIGNGYYYAVVYNANSVDLVVTPSPTMSITDVTHNEGDAGTTSYTFDVSLSSAFPANVTVDWASADGTATVAGSDYSSASGSLTFTPGQTTKQVTVNVNGDVLNEADEDFVVDLTNLTNASFADSQGVGTITNDDPLPSLSIDDVSHNEGNAGTTAYTFTVGLSAASGRNVTVDFASADGTATVAGSDYSSTTGSLTFTPGQTTKQVTVNVNGDVLNEADETFAVNLSNEVNASLADGSGQGSIVNDDPLPTVSIDDVTHSEGNFGGTSYDFTVSLNTASGRNVSVDWTTTNGTATAGSDFVGASGTVTFLPGQTTKTVTVTVIGDVANEANETFTVDLSNLVNVASADVSGLGTINNDDGVPTVAINSVSFPEGTGGVNVASFDVTLSNPSGYVVTVNYTTADGTATQPSDYTPVAGVLSFLPGDTVRNVLVPITTDSALELDETFTVTISAPVNATLGTSLGTGTIQNDDETIYVNSTNDVVDASPGNGVCETATAGECTLRAAVQESNSRAGTQTIVLQTGATYPLAIAGNNEDAAATGDLDVTDATTITGNGATVNGGALDRVFHVNSAGGVSLANLTVTNGLAVGTFPLDNGGGILGEGTGSLTLTSVTATANNADFGSGVSASNAGGITITGSTISANNGQVGGGLGLNAPATVTGGAITGNTASNCGGGVVIGANVTITGASIGTNTAANCGGGILHLAGTLTLTTNTITGNGAANFGGGMVIEADANLTGNTISTNTAQFGAGVVQTTATVTITGGSITGNTASGTDASGGGLGLAGTTQLDNVTISGNSAVNGAGIYQTSGALTITGSQISTNTASGFGGGILGTTVDVSTTQISGNTAAFAGGLWGLSGGSVTVKNTEIRDNVATVAAGGVVFQDAGSLDQSTVAGNTGTGLTAVGPSLTVTRSTVSSNAGTGIVSSATVASIEDSTVTANGAGGVSVSSGTMTITNSIIADQAVGPDCSGTVVSGGYNLDSDSTCGFTGTGDAQGVSANLGPLQLNGGTTRNHLPNAGSPAIDTGNPACNPVDQRGASRPNGAGCDKGSVES